MHPLIFFILCFVNSAHDVQVAFFKIHQDGEDINLEYVFEKEDVINTLEAQGIALSESTMQTYISEHFSIKINNTLHDLSFCNMQVKNKHIKIQNTISNITMPIKSLAIMNTCFLDIEDHSNIIEVRLTDRDRDFLMNKARTSILVTF